MYSTQAKYTAHDGTVHQMNHTLLVKFMWNLSMLVHRTCMYVLGWAIQHVPHNGGETLQDSRASYWCCAQRVGFYLYHVTLHSQTGISDSQRYHEKTKVLMQGKLIEVAYTLRTFLNQFSLGEILKKNRCISVRLVSEEDKSIWFW